MGTPLRLAAMALACVLDGSVAAAAAPRHAQEAADLLIVGGTVYSGAESDQPFVGDVAIRGDRIIHVGAQRRFKGVRTIDARGMIVAPGFVDAHAHPTPISAPAVPPNA